jgi:hypothetical protein
MESFIGMNIATEGIIETARRIWEAIQNFVVRIWKKIRDFYRTEMVVKKYKKTVADLKAAVKNAGALHESKHTFNISGASHGLMPQMHSAQVWSHLQHELNHFIRVDTDVFKDYAGAVLKMGGEIAKAIGEFDAKTPEKAATELRDKLAALHIRVAPEVTTSGFIGNGSLRYQNHERVMGESVDVALERIRLSGLKYTKGETPKSVSTGKDILDGVPAGNIHEMTDVLNAADKLLDILNAFYGQYINQFYKTSDACRAASNKASRAMIELDRAEFGNKSIGYYRSMLNFNTAFANWTNEPFIPMYQHTLRVVSSLFLLVRGSLSCYRSKN